MRMLHYRFTMKSFLICCVISVSVAAFGPVHVPTDRASIRTPVELRATSEPTRREVFQWSGAALSAWILGSSGGLPALAESPKNIVLTGGNSGIGFQAALELTQMGHNLILPCRTYQKSADACRRLEVQRSQGGSLIPAECDLASLSSVANFAKQVPTFLPEGQLLDTVCLNAGLSRNTEAKDVLRTEEGFELTVGTNHFGHFYLNHLLLPMVKPSVGRIVVTGSGVHDPESPGGAQGELATLGDLQGLERDGRNFEMVDGGPFNADKAYKDSKLCNMLFTRELQRRLDASPATRGITANCFSPGLIVGTGLFRDQNPLFVKVFDIAATNLFKVGETEEWGGSALVYTSTVDTKGGYYLSPPGSSKYGDKAFGNQFKLTEPSKEAHDDAKAKRLWELSEKLVGISA